MASKNSELCCVNGRFRRTIGRFVNSEGKVSPKKFLLGTDRNAAQLANLRLEQLWAEVVETTKREDEQRCREWKAWRELGATTYSLPDGVGVVGPVIEAHESPKPLAPREPLWTSETLQIAEAIRRGTSEIGVLTTPADSEVEDDPRSYAGRVARLRRSFSGVRFVPQDGARFTAGQAGTAHLASFHARAAQELAAEAAVATPEGAGQTLHGALDAYVESVRQTKVKGGKPTAWGKVLAEQARRLKGGHPDVTLDRFDLNAVERLVAYWTRRPHAKTTGRPIALDTVRAQLNAFKLFAHWLHRNPSWSWRKPEDFDDAVRVDLSALMTDDEVASLKDGVETYTVDELRTLWRYATDTERVLVLLALNCGFARAECVSLRLDEVDRAGGRVRRIRRKSRVYGEWALWPETLRALDWVGNERAAVRGAGEPWVLLSERGAQLQEYRVANTWNKLLDRVVKDQPAFRRLGFKHLRKTGAQLVRNASDGETAAVYLAHGDPVRGDELAGAYSNPVFAKVDLALAAVREALSPVFRQADDAFTQPRPRGGPNVGRGVRERIRALHAAGLRPDEVARGAGVSRATAYRHRAALAEGQGADLPRSADHTR